MVRNHFRRNRTTAGFTLVELLVVVSIIAVLIAILLPSLKKARDSAKRVNCAATIRGIGLASLTYAAEDTQENTIPIARGDALQRTTRCSYYGYGGKGGRGEGGSSKSIWGGRAFMGPSDRPLNRVIYKSGFAGPRIPGGPTSGRGANYDTETKADMAAFRCPADKGFAGMHQEAWRAERLSSYDHYGTSYSAVALFVYDTENPTALSSNSVYARPVSRVPNPANTLMYLENAGRYAYRATNPDYPHPDKCQEPFDESYVARGWHGQPWHFNAAYADGHAAWIKIRGFSIVGTGDSTNNDCWGKRCQCIMIRDTGWQMDTLPASVIKTRHVNFSG